MEWKNWVVGIRYFGRVGHGKSLWRMFKNIGNNIIESLAVCNIIAKFRTV